MESAELFLRSIVETANDAIITSDSGGNITSWNQAAVDIFGYSHDEIMGKPVITIMPQRFHVAHRKGMRRVTTTGESHIIDSTVEVLGLRKDRTEIPLELTLAKWTIKDGQFFTAIIRDITDRKRAEESIREPEENLKAYLESAPDGIYIIDLKGTFLYGNKKAEALMGYKREELIGKSFLKLKLLPTKQLAKAGKLLALNAMGRPTGLDEFELIRKDGSRISVEINTTPIKQKREIVVIGLVRDITERKRAEEVLKESEEKFSRAFHSNPHPMSIVTMAEGRYLDANDSYVQTFGFSLEELLGRTTVEMGILKGDSARRKILQSLKERQAIKNLEVEFHTRSGRKVETLLSGDKMEIGGQTCLLSVITDITQRKRMERNLGERVKELNCLYGIAEIVGRLDITLDEILQETVNLIPPSWQYPEVTCTRIKLANKEFKTDNFKPLQWRQSADIVVNGQKEGTLEVYYLVKKPASDEGPFLKEERLLINAIAERLGRITERKQAEEKRIQLIQELQETLKEVRTLSGLLPICAWCKKLRDDEGYWKSVEQYIGERTKAKFTHGMCPECQSKFLSERNSNTRVS